jgi:hypothetical protein
LATTSLGFTAPGVDQDWSKWLSCLRAVESLEQLTVRVECVQVVPAVAVGDLDPTHRVRDGRRGPP